MMEKLLNNPAALYTLWLFALSIVLFALMGTDKLKAVSGKRRIPEKTLFILAVLGGAIGGSAGMWSFRHKTRHWYFALFFPLLALLQLLLLVLLGTGVI